MALKKAGRSKTRNDWMATEEAAAAFAAAEAARRSVLMSNLVAGLIFHLSCVCSLHPVQLGLM